MSAPHAGPRAARADAMERVRSALCAAATSLAARGMPRIEISGHLMRPLAAYALGGPRFPRPHETRFWHAALAVQLAHEASLVHDDIVDGAAERRGSAALHATMGTARALVYGDHLLTIAYRSAALSGSLAFMQRFTRAVERTVAGERAQGATLGTAPGWARYRAIALGKSGELLGCALSTAPTLRAEPHRAARCAAVGRRLGLLYQMLDDLLDYCPRAHTGKPALGDYRAGRWTWVLDEAPGLAFGLDPDVAARRFHEARRGPSPAARALARLERELDAVRASLHEVAGGVTLLDGTLEEWRATARRAVAEEHDPRGSSRPRTPHATPPVPVPPAPSDWDAFMARHSRSFRFAAAFMPPRERARLAGVYAYCRYTDDLVDGSPSRPPVASGALLDEWLARSRDAYEGRVSGVPLLDAVMTDMAGAGVPFAYAELLVDGMRMDLARTSYADLPALRTYTYRVAAVVGLWLARLFGVRDPWVLDRAAALGHAMQLTNVLRDVGEDWERGRLYLPVDRLRAHGLAPEDVGALRAGRRPVDDAWRALLEELMAEAESGYRDAAAAFPLLPAFFRRPVAVAARVYAGIHHAIRRIDYDTARRRAYTSPGGKALLAAGALWSLRRTRPAPFLPRALELPGHGA